MIKLGKWMVILMVPFLLVGCKKNPAGSGNSLKDFLGNFEKMARENNREAMAKAFASPLSEVMVLNLKYEKVRKNLFQAVEKKFGKEARRLVDLHSMQAGKPFTIHTLDFSDPYEMGGKKQAVLYVQNPGQKRMFVRILQQQGAWKLMPLEEEEGWALSENYLKFRKATLEPDKKRINAYETLAEEIARGKVKREEIEERVAKIQTTGWNALNKLGREFKYRQGIPWSRRVDFYMAFRTPLEKLIFSLDVSDL